MCRSRDFHGTHELPLTNRGRALSSSDRRCCLHSNLSRPWGNQWKCKGGPSFVLLGGRRHNAGRIDCMGALLCPSWERVRFRAIFHLSVIPFARCILKRSHQNPGFSCGSRPPRQKRRRFGVTFSQNCSQPTRVLTNGESQVWRRKRAKPKEQFSSIFRITQFGSTYLVSTEDSFNSHGRRLSPTVRLKHASAGLSTQPALEPSVNSLDFCSIDHARTSAADTTRSRLCFNDFPAHVVMVKNPTYTWGSQLWNRSGNAMKKSQGQDTTYGDHTRNKCETCLSTPHPGSV